MLKIKNRVDRYVCPEGLYWAHKLRIVLNINFRDLSEVLQMAELKHSRQRDYIRENLRHRTDHPTADMIYEDIRKGYPRISLGTVYRNLTLLAESGRDTEADRTLRTGAF
jgi:hypothetical protein